MTYSVESFKRFHQFGHPEIFPCTNELLVTDMVLDQGLYHNMIYRLNNQKIMDIFGKSIKYLKNQDSSPQCCYNPVNPMLF